MTTTLPAEQPHLVRQDDHVCLGRLSTSSPPRPVATPKVVLTDSGLSAHLTGMSLRRARHPAAPVGPLIETFVLGEPGCPLAFTEQPVHLYHYRDRDQYEVDALLESASGEVVACEVKAAETVRSEGSAASSRWPPSRPPVSRVIPDLGECDVPTVG